MKDKLIWSVENRIVYVVNHSFPHSSNGYAVRTHMVAKGMQDNGCEVLVLTRPGYPYDLNKTGINPCHTLDNVRYFHLLAPKKTEMLRNEWLEKSEDAFLEFFRTFKPTAVVAASNWELALPAQKAAESLGLPFCYEVRGFWELSRASITPDYLDSDEFKRAVQNETLVAKGSQRVFTLNTLMKGELVNRGVQPDSIDIAPNGFEVGRMSVVNENQVALDTLTFGYIGSFARYEGLELLVDTTAELIRRGTKVQLILVGSSNPIGHQNSDCVVTQELRTRARELGVEQHINFVGRVSPEAIESYFNQIELIVIPRKKSIVSGLVTPIKPLEAAARGKYLLLSNIAPFEEFFGANIAKPITELDPKVLANDIESFKPEIKGSSAQNKANLDWVVENRTPQKITANLANFIKTIPSGIDRIRALVAEGYTLPASNTSLNRNEVHTFSPINIRENAKRVKCSVEAGALIKLTGSVSITQGEKKNAALVQVNIADTSISQEYAKKLGLAYSEKLGLFKYIPLNNESWSIQFKVPTGIDELELVYRAWYPNGDIVLSVSELKLIQPFEVQLAKYINEHGVELPNQILEAISNEYGSEELAKNLRKVFDLGHISLASDLLLHIKPEHKIKYARNVNTILGYIDFAKRLPYVTGKRVKRLESSNRVCLIAHTALPFHSNGYATRTHEIAKQLNKSYDLTVITRPGYPYDVLSVENSEQLNVIDGVHYKNCLGAHYYDDSLSTYVEKASRVLLKEFIELKPKVVHAASSIHNSLPALLAARKLGLPFVYEVRGFWEITRASVNPMWGESERYEIEHNLECYIAKNADHVVALTGGIKKELMANGIASDKISVVSNAISLDKFSSEITEQNTLSQERGSVATIGYIGSIVEYEGLEDLIDALELVAEKGIDFKFVIAGDGNKFDSLKHKVENSPIAEKVEVLGRIPHEDVGDLIKTIDIMPLPRKPLPVCEMVSPLKPFESMICKKALIGSNVAAIAEIIQHNETGLLFEKGDIKDLASKLAELIQNPELRKKLGESAYEWVTKYKTWEKVSENYHTIYQNAEAAFNQSECSNQAPVKVLVYGDVDLNYIDGSSIWAASISDVLSSVKGAEVDILLKSDAYKSKVIKQINGLNKTVRFISPSQFNKQQRLKPEEATEIIQQLQQNNDYDAVLVRGQKIYEGLAKLPELDGTLWIYPIEILKKDEITDADLIPLKRARKLLCQSHAFEKRLLDYGFNKENIVFVPPMVPDKVQKQKSPSKSNQSKKIVYAGKFDEQWGVLEMFETFRELHSLDNGVELHVYGEKIHNPSKCAEFENKIKGYLKMPGVVWHKGVERAVVLDNLPSYDLAWAWRRPELDKDTHEISTKFLEYSSSSLPIVCLDGGMNKSLLGEDYPLFVEEQCELVGKVRDFLSNDRLLNLASERCYQAVTPFFFSSVTNNHFQPAIDSIRCDKQDSILVAGHDLKFINSHVRRFREKGFKVSIDKWKGHTVNNEWQSYSKLADSDVVISEWALGNSVWYTNKKLLNQKHMVRLHLQEESTEFPENLNPEHIEFFNYINHQVQRNVNEKFFDNRNVGEFFPNYIHFDAFSLPKSTESQFALGFIGIVPQRKRFDLALDLLEKLRAVDIRYTLRVKGKLPEDFPWMKKRTEELAYYEAQYKRIAESKLLKGAVIFDGHGNDMDTWFTKVGFIVSTSDFEGSHQAVAEGMASGCIPLILPWEGADELYPEEYVFKNTDEMVSKVVNGVQKNETNQVQQYVKNWDIELLNEKLLQRLGLN